MTTVEAIAPPSRWGLLWTSRRTLKLLVSRDLKVKYANSALGYLWSVLDPMMMAGVYWFIFTVLIKRSLGSEPYIVFLLCAMLPWQWASGTIRASMRALSKDAKLVRSTSLPREIWVLRSVASRAVEFVFSLPVLAFFAIVTNAHLTWHVVFFPVAMVIQTALLLGLSMILAPVAVLYDDVDRLVRIVLRLLFYFSPIIYGVHDIQHRLGDVAATFYVLNPFAGLFDLYRTAFFADQWEGPTGILVSIAAAVVALALGSVVFRRLESTVLKEI